MTAEELVALVEAFDWDAWRTSLKAAYLPVYRDFVVAQASKVADANGIAFNADDPFLASHVTEYVGERIVQLSDTTRKDVIRVVRKALASDESLGTAELQDLVLETVRTRYADYEAWRALRIARTEAGIAYNHAGVLGAHQAGFTHVDVTDGEDDEECAAANGAVWTIEEALSNPLGHPNCRRQFAPHVDDGTGR